MRTTLYWAQVSNSIYQFLQWDFANLMTITNCGSASKNCKFQRTVVKPTDRCKRQKTVLKPEERPETCLKRMFHFVVEETISFTLVTGSEMIRAPSGLKVLR